MKQRQFLDVVDEAEAHRRFAAACAHLAPEVEEVPLDRARGRVLAADVFAPVDVPAFDRANVDGFAVRAADTFGAEELRPVRLQVAAVSLAAGQPPPEGFERGPRLGRAPSPPGGSCPAAPTPWSWSRTPCPTATPSGCSAPPSPAARSPSPGPTSAAATWSSFAAGA